LNVSRDRTSRSAGFTLIEVVVATAVATVLILATASLTTTLATAAARQKAASSAQGRRALALALLRHDFGGRLAVAPAQGARGDSDGSTRQIEFSTTADAFGREGQGRFQRHLQYRAGPQGLWRGESETGSTPVVPVLEEPVTFDFWDPVSKSWADQPSPRTTALRLTFLRVPAERVIVR
jgi:prepilin-type N-terminal cleavage/methylation domain-containing protein